MAKTLKVACIQLNTGPDIAQNLEVTCDLIRNAAASGARFIATPENTCQMRSPIMSLVAAARPEEDHETLAALQALAAELGVSILIGSLAITLGKRKLANRSFMIADNGEVTARYDKTHLFDVDLPNGESYKESAVFQPGDEAVLADGPGDTRIGLSVCYDIRFPYLYRTLAKAGAQILTVPAAFSVPTGEAHWETLLRARAIETGCFVLAPAQGGEHDGGRCTWGHSMIINPWGEVLADGGKQPGIIMADLNLDEVEAARGAVPALTHDRDFQLKT